MAVIVNENEATGYPQLAVGPAPVVLPPIKIPPALPAASVAAAKAAYRAAGYPEEIIAAAPWPTADKTIAPIHDARDGVAISSDAQQRAYQHLYDHATDKTSVLQAAKQAGVQLKAKDGTFLAAEGVEGNQIAYSFQYPDSSEVPVEDFAAFDGLMKSGLNALHVPQPMAQAFVTSIVNTANSISDDATDETMAAQFAREGDTLRNLADGPEIIRLALLGDAALKKAAPALYATLAESWAFHSASAQIALASLGRHVERGSKRA